MCFGGKIYVLLAEIEQTHTTQYRRSTNSSNNKWEKNVYENQEIYTTKWGAHYIISCARVSCSSVSLVCYRRALTMLFGIERGREEERKCKEWSNIHLHNNNNKAKFSYLTSAHKHTHTRTGHLKILNSQYYYSSYAFNAAYFVAVKQRKRKRKKVQKQPTTAT